MPSTAQPFSSNVISNSIEIKPVNISPSSSLVPLSDGPKMNNMGSNSSQLGLSEPQAVKPYLMFVYA
jgi:hypothetical protein